MSEDVDRVNARRAIRDALAGIPAHTIRCTCGRVVYRYLPADPALDLHGEGPDRWPPDMMREMRCEEHGPLVPISLAEFVARARAARSTKLPPQSAI